MTNVYYSPQEWGLEVVADIDYSSGDYEFDMRVVWTDAEGVLYTARSAGCSCPIPFEEFDSLAALERADIRELEREAEAETTYRTAAEREAFLRAVRKYRLTECPSCGNIARVPDFDYLCGDCRM